MYVVVVIIYSLVAAFLKHFGLIPRWGNWQIFNTIHYKILLSYIHFPCCHWWLHYVMVRHVVTTFHHGEACDDYIASWWVIRWLHYVMVRHVVTTFHHGEACDDYIASWWVIRWLHYVMVRHVVTTFHHGEACDDYIASWWVIQWLHYVMVRHVVPTLHMCCHGDYITSWWGM